MTFPNMRGALDLAPVLRRIPRVHGPAAADIRPRGHRLAAASEAPMGVLLSPYVDGNVLVLESGRTRAPVAAELRDSIARVRRRRGGRRC